MLLASHTYSDTTGDILDPSTISGSYEPCSGSDCWGGYSGGSNPSWNGGTARWGYGAGQLAWNYALEQALASAGINIDGYNYSWRLKNGDANAGQNDGNDYMRISVRLYDAENNELWGKQYNLDGTYDWQYFNGQELFTSPLSGGDVSTVIIRAEGDDPGFWAGHYGPEFDASASSVTLIYSNNPCYPDPLVDSTCPGYAEAYANKLLEEQLAAQQAAALETPIVQTTTTPEQQTFSTPDPVQLGGTEVAGTNTVDQGQPGVQQEEDSNDDKKQKLDLVRSLDPANNTSLISSITAGPTTTGQEEIPGMEQVQAAEQQSMSGGMSDEMGMGSIESQIANGMVPLETESQSSVASNQTNTETRQERRERLKEITENRANEISEQNADAESMDEQSQQQLEQLALMNYVPGFDAYQTSLLGGVYPDAAFYKPTTVPESRKGLRNGLAQQLLHEQLVEMQYGERK